MKWLLTAFGWFFVVAGLVAVLVPYVRRRADLLTTWNLFLLGSVNFVGFATIQSGTAPWHLYGSFNEGDYLRFVLGAIVFYTVAFLSYHYVVWPRRLAHSRLRKWAPARPAVLVWGILASWLLVLARVLAPDVQLLGQLLFFAGLCSSNFAIVFAFYLWDRWRLNVLALVLLLAAVGISLLIALGEGTGRIYALSSLMAVPFCWYWSRLRYKPARSTLIPLGVGFVVTLIAIAGYSHIRHASESPHKGLVELAIDRVRAIPAAFMERGTTGIIGGDTTDVSLLSIQRYTGQAEPYPFHSLVYVVTQPIPRAWWPDKVGALGETLPRESGRWIHGYISLGPGIVGHGYYEGGLHMLAFYGFLFAICFRFIDELLMTQASNPFLVGIVASIVGFFIALPRGELGLYITHIVAGFMTGFLLNWMGRLLFGTVVYQSMEEQPQPEELPVSDERCANWA